MLHLRKVLLNIVGSSDYCNIIKPLENERFLEKFDSLRKGFSRTEEAVRRRANGQPCGGDCIVSHKAWENNAGTVFLDISRITDAQVMEIPHSSEVVISL